MTSTRSHLYRRMFGVSSIVCRSVGTMRLPFTYVDYVVHELERVIANKEQDLFAATVDLVNGISDINKANADVQVEDFDDQEKKDTCTSVHRVCILKLPSCPIFDAFQTRYTQGSLIKQVGGQAERIGQFPLSPAIGRLLSVYDREMSNFLDEVNSRLDDCSDEYKQRLEEIIKTAKAQYDAITPKA